MPVSRLPAFGCSGGLASSCARMSGDALNKIHCSPLTDTAIDDWVLGNASTDPSRTPRQLRQLQFHCGKPPPAADPRTLTFIAPPQTCSVLYTTPRVNARQKKSAQSGGLWHHVATQRTLKYMVTSKPTRKSTYSGLVHMVLSSIQKLAVWSSVMPKPMTLQRADPAMDTINVGRGNLRGSTTSRARSSGLINSLKRQNSCQTGPLIN